MKTLKKLDGSFGDPDLDYLRGLADRHGAVLVDRLPGLEIPALAKLVRMRWSTTSRAGELSLEVEGKSELACLLESAHARHDDLEQMRIVPRDRPGGVELHQITIARIADGRGGEMISVDLLFPSWPPDESHE